MENCLIKEPTFLNAEKLFKLYEIRGSKKFYKLDTDSLTLTNIMKLADSWFLGDILAGLYHVT